MEADEAAEIDRGTRQIGVRTRGQPAPEIPPMFDIWDRFYAKAVAADKAFDHENNMERRRRRRINQLKWDMNIQRRAEIQRLIEYRHSHSCDTDDAETYLDAVLPHLFRIHSASRRLDQAIADWARNWVPTLDQAFVADVVERARIEDPRLLKADAIAKLLKVTQAERTILKLRTIGACDRTKRQRQIDRKRRNTEIQRERRARNGATPRTHSKAATQPWKVLGISRSTYYDRLQKGQIEAPANPNRTNSSSVVRSTIPLVTSQSDRCDPAGQGPASKASSTPPVGADGPTPGGTPKAVSAGRSRALPHSEDGFIEQPDLLFDWQPIGTVAQAVIQNYTGGIMPPAVIQAMRAKQKARVLRQEDVAHRIGVSRPHLANALRGRIGLSQQAAARVRDWLAAA